VKGAAISLTLDAFIVLMLYGLGFDADWTFYFGLGGVVAIVVDGYLRLLEKP